jgi:acetyl esterase/lipase
MTRQCVPTIDRAGYLLTFRVLAAFRQQDYLLDEPAARSLLVTTLLGHHPPSLVRSPYISPACRQLSGQPGLFAKCERLFASARVNRLKSMLTPRIASVPPTFVHYGGAERLQSEIEALIEGLELDGVPTTVVYSPDAVHDVCVLSAWDERDRDRIYETAGRWLGALRDARAEGRGAESVAGKR